MGTVIPRGEEKELSLTLSLSRLFTADQLSPER